MKKGIRQIIKNGEELATIDAPFHEGRSFEGWFIYKDGNYGTEVKFGEPIDLSDLEKDDEVTVAAKYSNKYTLEFKDEFGASLGTHIIDADDPEYTLDEQYTPADQDKAFLGWKPDEASTGKISGANGETAPYKNGTKIKLTGNAVLVAYTPKGKWLVFDENAVGATYMAPQFVENGKKTVRPDTVPTRSGYVFDGWYLRDNPPANVGDDPSDDGALSPYGFNEEITKKTTLYAKWKDADLAKYTIIIWTENQARDGYAYKESIVKEGKPGTVIDDKIIKMNDYDIVIAGKTASDNRKIEIVGFKPDSVD